MVDLSAATSSRHIFLAPPSENSATRESANCLTNTTEKIYF